MANTFTLIESVTVGSGGAASIDFTSIPATYTDLCLKVSLKTNPNAGVESVTIEFNGSPTYTLRRLYADGATIASDSATNKYFLIANADAATVTSVFGNGEVYIPNYTGTTNKSFSADSVAEINATSGNFMEMVAGMATLTSAITTITLKPFTISNSFVQYSTAYLYGVSNA
jgi:hypothetical protein